ncbi:MAG: hypothetical protein JWR59_463 [Brevundimonas sp.]|nr:hypothetical protein [Brevundimonas sp.]
MRMDPSDAPASRPRRSTKATDIRSPALTMLAPAAKRIKSAERVLQVLEYFSVHQHHEATVMDIAKAHDLPQSSTSELLKCLTSLGYLAHNPYGRTYTPTARVALLGAGVSPLLLQGGPVLEMLAELNSQSGEFVVLGMPVGLTVRYVHVLPSTRLVTTVVPERTCVPLHTAMGKALMSTLPDADIRRFVHRLNAEVGEKWRVGPADFMAEIADVRAAGYAVTYNGVWRGGGMVCLALPDQGESQLLGVGIGSDAETTRDRADEFAEMIRAATARHLSGGRAAIRSSFAVT